MTSKIKNYIHAHYYTSTHVFYVLYSDTAVLFTWKSFEGTQWLCDAVYTSAENNNAGGLTEFEFWPMIKHNLSSNVIIRIPYLRHDQNTLVIDNPAYVYCVLYVRYSHRECRRVVMNWRFIRTAFLYLFFVYLNNNSGIVARINNNNSFIFIEFDFFPD